jgi:group I intron endonuclease
MESIIRVQDVRTVTIYKIHNGSTGKSYIGSTRSSVFSRWKRHVENLNNNKYSGDFQDDWNKYNIDVWVFSILEIGVILEEQYSREQHWIDFYVKENEYNTNKFVSRATKYRQILDMLSSGATYFQIRDTLGVSLGTISNVKKRYRLP